MNQAKNHISRHMHIEQAQLNEIALEDVEFADDAALLISQTVEQLLTASNPAAMSVEHETLMAHGVPCKGYWVETSKELVLYIWHRNFWRTVVVPYHAWSLRDDITLN